MLGLRCRQLPARALALKVGIRSTFLATLLNRSTSQQRGPAVLRPRHRLSHVSTTRGCLTAPGHCPILARFLRQTRLEMWIGGDCSATQPMGKILHRPCHRWDGAVLTRRNRQKSTTTTLRVPRQLPSLCLNECCLGILVGRAGRRRGRRETLSS